MGNKADQLLMHHMLNDEPHERFLSLLESQMNPVPHSFDLYSLAQRHHLDRVRFTTAQLLYHHPPQRVSFLLVMRLL